LFGLTTSIQRKWGQGLDIGIYEGHVWNTTNHEETIHTLNNHHYLYLHCSFL